MKRKRALVLVSICFLVLALTAFAGCADRPGQIGLSATEYDFGTIPNTKPVSKVFEIRNTGRGKLEIRGVSTSCGCTTAAIDKNQLAPDESAQLTVTFDPQAHDGATGEFVRIVYVRSDDLGTPEATLTIRVTVVES